ncbi:MAG TPA: outer membrane beta-barrel protein [Afifellaceae bacterium]|nr:outer membrane beta-barrel protein [Afifellaceae bacterium]
MRSASSVFLLSGVALTAISGSAFAGEGQAAATGVSVSTYSPGRTVVDWTGFYAGIHGGYLWGILDTDYFYDLDLEPNGPLAGVQAGGLFQNGRFVYGAEADFALATGDDQDCLFGCTEGFSADLQWLATLRAILGFAQDSYMVYATGGAAIGSLDIGIIDFGSVPTSDETLTGWTAGFGGSVRVSQRVSVNAQYLYFDLGDFSRDPSWGSPINYDVTGHTGRIAVNIHY